MKLFNLFRRPPPATAPAREAAGTNRDPRDEPGFRRLTGGSDPRDLLPMTQTRMQRVAMGLWESTPLGHWMVEVSLAFLLAEGVRAKAEDPQAQAWLDDFWDDPITDLDATLITRARELALFGEQIWPVFVGIDGHVRLAYLDPSDVEDVVCDPENSAVQIGIITRPDACQRKRRYRILYEGADEDLFAPGTVALRRTFDSGDCFYFRVNDLMCGQRGRSDLLAAADWIDALDQFLFGELERADYMRAFIWDVTLTGATQEEVEQRAAALKVPHTAGARVHNENESWETRSPDIKAEDGETAARLFRLHAMGAQGLPEHWYGGGGDVNRATAGEMGAPAYKMLTMRQQTLKRMLERVCRYALTQRLAARGRTLDRGDGAWKPKIEFPELVAQDVSRFSAALAQVVSAVAAAVAEGLLPRAEAVRLIAAMAAYLGVEIDPEQALAEAREESLAEREADLIVDPAPDPAGSNPADPAPRADPA
ncbi:hypothetical protein [Roseospirillum parvum]|uniref:Phage portal protein, SPP1 Gp6-like n=1 Tax=Roseospirillum parvum TaxID=83401 RepID=A0A1G8EXX7_9PROT|nr:hypothetical protein [Roseospirillum parvum]SDH74753.1 hypothetical protein SAMN05421742_11176 [Roseospirillum parvum]